MIARTRGSVGDAVANRPTTLAEYLTILGRRKAILIALPVIAAASAFAVSLGQSARYRATSTVLVNRSSIVSSITNVVDPTIGDAARFLTTQASVARSPVLAARVVKAAHTTGVTPGQLLADSTVTPEADADVLDISVSAGNAGEATALANAYAEQFTRYKTELDTAKVGSALRTLRSRVAELRAHGASQATLATLLQYQTQLETIGTLLANNTSVLQPAGGASKLRPRPSHDALLGLLLGAVLGFVLAFLVEALDRRVRSEQEIEDTLGLPLLGRLARPPQHLRDTRGLVMLTESESTHAEAFRKLRTSIEFLTLADEARTLMLTSAVPHEGKSTTAANLAIAFAEAGRKVVVVDLDFRNPSLHRFFRTGAERGIGDIILGGEPVSNVLRTVALPSGVSHAYLSRNGEPRSGRRRDHSGEIELHLLPAGTPAPAAAGLVESPALADLLADLEGMFDVVLLDTPPVLAIGDAMAATTYADAVLIVLHMGVERPLLRDLARELGQSRARPLGFVLTGVPEHEGYGYYGYGLQPYELPGKKQGESARPERV